MTTNLGSKLSKEKVLNPRQIKVKGFKITPDVVIGWEPVPEPIKDPELFQRVTKLVMDELKNFFRPEF
jgi:ATP-dependent Clp protease ATP-binding subunit ClpA